ncbi:MAG: FMN-binding protein [Patescibacteria group bacterium]
MTFKQIQKLFLSLFLIGSFSIYTFWRARTDVIARPVLLLPSKQSPTDATTSNVPTNVAVPEPVSVQDINNIIRKYTGKNEKEDNYIPPSTQKLTPAPTPMPSKMPVTMPTSRTSMMGMSYKDGSYVGSASYAYTGRIQVTTIISVGKIADVQVIDASQNRTSRQINADALPTLKTETIQAQSTNVNAVSGATYTTGAYIESLTSALAKARA